MKSISVLVKFIVILLVSLNSFSQEQLFSFIPSAHLTVTDNKTTNLIFPFSVKNIDRGSKDILVQQPGGTENIVQVKAAKLNFEQTNLSVITIDGKLYSFIVDYSEQPRQLNIVINNNDSLTGSSIAPVSLSVGYNEAVMKSVAEKVLEEKASRIKADKRDKVKLEVNGIYIKDDILYFRLQIKNKSNISFDIDNVRFSIKDRQESKRTATQEIQLTPVYIYKAFNKVQADSVASCIIAFPKFTLPDSKYLLIDVLEKDGSRNLRIVLKGHPLERVTTINE
jgi:conjugative transposon TraN protein